MSQTRPVSTIMVLTEQAATYLTGSDQPASHIHNEEPVNFSSRLFASINCYNLFSSSTELGRAR